LALVWMGLSPRPLRFRPGYGNDATKSGPSLPNLPASYGTYTLTLELK
jgi:hypothetical protein